MAQMAASSTTRMTDNFGIALLTSSKVLNVSKQYPIDSSPYIHFVVSLGTSFNQKGHIHIEPTTVVRPHLGECHNELDLRKTMEKCLVVNEFGKITPKLYILRVFCTS